MVAFVLAQMETGLIGDDDVQRVGIGVSDMPQEDRMDSLVNAGVNCSSQAWVPSTSRDFVEIAPLVAGGGGPALGAQVNPGAAAQGLAVVEGVCEGFVGQALPLLEAIDPQPPPSPRGGRPRAPLG